MHKNSAGEINSNSKPEARCLNPMLVIQSSSLTVLFSSKKSSLIHSGILLLREPHLREAEASECFYLKLTAWLEFYFSSFTKRSMKPK